MFIRQVTLARSRQSSPLTHFSCPSQHTSNQSHGTQTVVVRRDRVCDTGRVGVGVDDTDSRDVVETTLVQQDNVLDGVQANNKVGLKCTVRFQFLFPEIIQRLIQAVHNLLFAMAQDLLAIGQATRDPTLENVISLSQFRSSDHGTLLSLSRARKENQSTPVGNLLHDLGRTSEVSRCHIKGDDVSSLPDTEDIARVLGVPAGSRVSKVCLVGEEHFEGNVGGLRRVFEEALWPVDAGHIATETVEFDS